MIQPGDLRCLVVDDAPAQRRSMCSLLDQMGCRNAAQARDGVHALQMLRQGRFDVVICDINMPNMNGFDLLAAVKADPGLDHVPVLMVSTEVKGEDIALATAYGAACCIARPQTRAALEHQLRRALRAPVLV